MPKWRCGDDVAEGDREDGDEALTNAMANVSEKGSTDGVKVNLNACKTLALVGNCE